MNQDNRETVSDMTVVLVAQALVVLFIAAAVGVNAGAITNAIANLWGG